MKTKSIKTEMPDQAGNVKKSKPKATAVKSSVKKPKKEIIDVYKRQILYNLPSYQGIS